MVDQPRWTVNPPTPDVEDFELEGRGFYIRVSVNADELTRILPTDGPGGDDRQVTIDNVDKVRKVLRALGLMP